MPALGDKEIRVEHEENVLKHYWYVLRRLRTRELEHLPCTISGLEVLTAAGTFRVIRIGSLGARPWRLG